MTESEAALNTASCKHCGRRIKWSDIFGWYHGIIGAGWNTSCADDEHRAEPTYVWLEGGSNYLTVDDWLRIEKARAEVDVRRRLYYSHLIDDYTNDEHAGDPDHQHKFVPEENQPKGRLNLICSCHLRMEGPAND